MNGLPDDTAGAPPVSPQPHFQIKETTVLFPCVAIDRPFTYAVSVAFCAFEDVFGAAFYGVLVAFGYLTAQDPETMQLFKLAEARQKYRAKAKQLALLRASKASNQPYDERMLRRLEVHEYRIALYVPDASNDD